MSVPKTDYKMNQTRVRERMIRSWEKHGMAKTIPMNEDNLCHFFQKVKMRDSLNDAKVEVWDCPHCPLKDCDSPTSAYNRKDYASILKALSLWLTPQEVKEQVIKTLEDNDLPAYITTHDLIMKVMELNGPAPAGLAREAYISALKEWKV